MKRTRVGTLIVVFVLAFAVRGAAVAAGDSALDKASGLIDKHDYKGAIALLDGIIARDPQNVRALTIRGDAKDDNGDSAGALVDYNAAIAINPDYEYAYATRCGTQAELNHLSSAITDCTKALSLTPKDDMALRYRSGAYFFLGDYQLAMQDAQAAMAIDSSNAGNVLARCRASAGLKRADGYADCNTYVSYQPSDANGYFYRGRMELLSEKYGDAKNDFHKALQLDDTYTGAHYWLADIALRQQAYNEAISEADAYLAQYATDGDTLLLRATAEQKLGQLQAARTDANAALKQYRIDNDSDGQATVQAFLKELDKP